MRCVRRRSPLPAMQKDPPNCRPCPAMRDPDLAEIRRLELHARELRRGRPVSPDTQRHNERVAEGLRVTGDVIGWMRTGEGPGQGVPVARRARLGSFVEELGLVRPSEPCKATRPTVD